MPGFKTNKLKTKLWTLAIAGLALLTSLSFGAVSFAQIPESEITMSPTSIKLALDPGDNYSGQFKVINSGKTDFDFNVYAKPYKISNSNYDSDFESSNERTQINRWVKFDQTKFSLKAGEDLDINFKVDVPKDVPAGGQYAAIFAETTEPNKDGAANNLEVKKRVGVLLYAKVNGDTREGGELKDFKSNSFLISSPIKSTWSVSNSGNTDFMVKHETLIEDKFSDTKYSRSNEAIVLPDTTRDFTEIWNDESKQEGEEKPPTFGLYNVKTTIKFLDKTEVKEQTVLLIPMFVLVILIVILLAIIGGIIYAVKKKSASKIKF